MKQIALLIISLSIAILSTGGEAFAYNNIASLDTLIQRAGQSIRPKDTFRQLNKSIDVWNIYSSSYKLVQQEFSTTVLSTVRAMAGEINGKYNCNMTLNDIWNILAPITEINNDIQWALAVINENTSPEDNASFASSCIKLIQCMWGTKEISANTSSITAKAGANLQDLWFQTCKTYATEVYNAKSRILAPTISLSSTVQWNDLFYNGEANDAPYDLLLDIQRIGDVLFSDNQQTDKTLFFTFPNNSIAWFQALGFDGATSNSAANNPLGLGWEWSSNNWSNNQTNSQQNANYQNSNLPSSPSNPWWWYNSTIAINPSSNTSIENYACLPPSQTNSDGTANNNDASNTDTSSENNESDNADPSSWWGLNNPAQWVFNSNTSFYSPIVSAQDNPIVDNADRESPDDYIVQSAAIKSCVSKCEWLKSADKAMCAAKCMCGTSYTKDSLFGLSVCTIPTTQTDVAWSKTVQSIEDIISEINNIFLALKNSGQMIKHTKTTEMFDTALSKIKINKILAFDINIGFKPILDSKPDFKSTQESQDATDNLQKGNYGSIDIRNEKNKYLTLYNPILEEARKKWGTDLAAIQDNIKTANAQIQAFNERLLTDGTASATAQSQNAEVTDIIKQFLEQNIRFLTYLNDSLTNVQTTADQFRQKIQAGE
jgi:hypothetical protein